MKLCTGDLLKISAFTASFRSTGLSTLRWGAKVLSGTFDVHRDLPVQVKWGKEHPLCPAKKMPHILGKMLDCMQTDVAAASKLRTVQASVA